MEEQVEMRRGCADRSAQSAAASGCSAEVEVWDPRETEDKDEVRERSLVSHRAPASSRVVPNGGGSVVAGGEVVLVLTGS